MSKLYVGDNPSVFVDEIFDVYFVSPSLSLKVVYFSKIAKQD